MTANDNKNPNSVFLDTLKYTKIYPVIDNIKNIWVLLKKYDEFNRSDFIECINNYIDELKSEEFTENYRLGQTWDYFFDHKELLRDMMIFYMNLPPQQWTKILDDYTDYSTSEIVEFIIQHVDYFSLDPNDFKFYSSALGD